MTIEQEVDIEDGFDFKVHGDRAKGQYEKIRDAYADCADTIRSILSKTLSERGVKVHSIESRAKDVDSFAKKSQREDSKDPSKPKYLDPIADIRDLAGVRIITFFLEDIPKVQAAIREQFVVREESDRGALLGNKQVGYESLHFEVVFQETRLGLPEYSRYRDFVAEIQLRTILQHVWAEIEHDIQYKAETSLPREVSRRFAWLAGLIAIGDREFQAIADSNRKIQQKDRESLAEGRLDQIELTAASLKLFLNERLLVDGRISDSGYEAALTSLLALGFTSIEQLSACMGHYDTELISRVLTGGRQGQLTRLDQILLAALGEQYIERKHLTRDEANEARLKLERLKKRRIPTGTYQLPALTEGVS